MSETMLKAANILIVLTALACLAALGVSVYPGALQTVLIFSFFVGIMILPVIGLIILVRVIIYWRRGKLNRESFANMRAPRIQIIAVLAMMFVTYGLLKLYVPRRVAFEYSRSAFEAAAQKVQASSGRVDCEDWIGLYKVRDCSVDARGGVYFLVLERGFEPVSYGFAYEPNRAGTPYGDLRFRLHRLGRGWYWFWAADDWD